MLITQGLKVNFCPKLKNAKPVVVWIFALKRSFKCKNYENSHFNFWTKNWILPKMCVENDILKVHFRHSWRQYCLFWWQRSKVQLLWDQKLHLKDFFLHLHLICKGLLSSLQLNNFSNRRLLRLFHGLGPSIHRMYCTWKILRLRHWLLNHLQKKGIFHKNNKKVWQFWQHKVSSPIQ